MVQISKRNGSLDEPGQLHSSEDVQKRADQTIRPVTLSRRALAGIGGAIAAHQVLPENALGGVGADHVALEANGLQESMGDHVLAVATAHQLATDAGIEVLEAGGSAADASVAVASVLSVVEPWFSSALGGGTWGLYFDADAQEVTSLDSVGPVGSLASIEDYEARADMPGAHQAIVPGAWDGWMRWLDRYGRLDLGVVLAPAIRTARVGFPASHHLVFWLREHEEAILGLPSAAAIYAPEGELVEIDDTVYQRAMADTFEALSTAYAMTDSASREDRIQAARDYFYRGPIAEAIIAFSQEQSGYLTPDDLAGFSAAIVPSIQTEFGEGISVHQNPPNCQGITMLLALNILRGFDFGGLSIDDPDVVHLQIEALKLAFADRFAFVGDPDRIDVPVDDLLSEDHAQRQRLRIDMGQAMAWPIEAGLAASRATHTSTFHVVDREGNAAAVTTSLGAQFLVVGDTGIHINERMRFLSVEVGNVNQLTPGQKVRHTSCPYIAMRNRRPYIIGGNTGIDTQPQAQLQQFLGVHQFGLSAQEAVDRPRFVSTAFPTTTFPYTVANTLTMEEGFPEALVDELEERGHDVIVGAGLFGTAQMIVVNEDGSDAQTGAESRSRTASGAVVPPAA